MSDYAVDQMYFEPTFLSEMVHSLPHMSFTFCYFWSVDDTFNPFSYQYVLSLILIGSIPVAIILIGFLILGIHLLQDRLSETVKPETKCHCEAQRLLRICAILFIVMIILEVILHIAVLRSLPLTVLPETLGMADFHTYQVKKVDALVGQLDIGKVEFIKEMVPDFVKDMTHAYKAIAENVVLAGIKVRERQIAPREMMMPFAQYVALFEWFRFIFFMTIWFIAMVICLMKGQTLDGRGRTSAKCGIFALIFCGIMSILLTVITVGFADACQDPAAAAAKTIPHEIKQEFLAYQYQRMCKAYRTEMYESMRKFKVAVRNARRQALRQIEINLMVFDPMVNAYTTDTMWPIREKVSAGYSGWNLFARLLYKQQIDRYDTYKHKRLYAQAIYKDMATFQEKMTNGSWSDRLYCFEKDDATEEFMDFKDDARLLCSGDRVLIWLLLQLILLLTIGVFFFNIVRVHIAHMRWKKNPEN